MSNKEAIEMLQQDIDLMIDDLTCSTLSKHTKKHLENWLTVEQIAIKAIRERMTMKYKLKKRNKKLMRTTAIVFLLLLMCVLFLPFLK